MLGWGPWCHLCPWELDEMESDAMGCNKVGWNRMGWDGMLTVTTPAHADLSSPTHLTSSSL